MKERTIEKYLATKRRPDVVFKMTAMEAVSFAHVVVTLQNNHLIAHEIHSAIAKKFFLVGQQISREVFTGPYEGQTISEQIEIVGKSGHADVSITLPAVEMVIFSDFCGDFVNDDFKGRLPEVYRVAERFVKEAALLVASVNDELTGKKTNELGLTVPLAKA